MSVSLNTIENIVNNVEKVIIGKRPTIEQVMLSLICQGHVLIEDVPGVGKTEMVSAIAKSINASFKRIQFTPDVLPSDITGFSIFNQKTNDFEYRDGAVMCNILLADEINRTTPKTQSSLLESMEEYQVTVDGVTHKLPKPFFVLATQNPIEYLGTNPLPEAQMDRFFMKVSIGYPTAEQESEILSKYKTANPLETLTAVASVSDIVLVQQEVKDIYVDKSINDYIVDIINKTRTSDLVVLGSSPRGSLNLSRGAQAVALMNGRDYVVPDDVKKVAVPILAHRIHMKQEAKIKKITARDLVLRILDSTMVPVIENVKK